MTETNPPHPTLWVQALQAVRQHIQCCNAHPARTVVLVPYAQLMAQAQYQWACMQPYGFAPRFETTRNWAERLGGFIPEAFDFAHNTARDSLTAYALLHAAGLASQRELLLSALLEAAGQLAMRVAAIQPTQRTAWLHEQRAALSVADDDPTAGSLRWEHAVARLALEWVTASRHATDVLFEPHVRTGVDALVVLDGFEPDTLAHALCDLWGTRAQIVPLYCPPSATSAPERFRYGRIDLHAAHDAEDEAQRAAACVLEHVAVGRTPVALASTDRALVRRISALLQSVGLQPKDENGWSLSTTRAGAQVMMALRACAWNAASDVLLDWLKHVPAIPHDTLSTLEGWLRRNALTQWSQALKQAHILHIPEALIPLLPQIAAWQATLQAARPLAQWLQALRQLLQASGQWTLLQQDPAGARVLLELHLEEGLQHALDSAAQAQHPQTLARFTRWVDQVLEAARYKPQWNWSSPAEVVILPLPQLLARSFAALVLPGCDEKRLPIAPDPAGQWSISQRQALGLPTRPMLEALQRAVWDAALHIARIDLLWRTSEGAQPVLASPLLLELQQRNHCNDDSDGDGGSYLLRTGHEPRQPRHIHATPCPAPAPTGAALAIAQLSASSYHDLRECPYRFYALRQLGLRTHEELESGIDKRDFGAWVHKVLQYFHRALQAKPTHNTQERIAYMNQAAHQAQRALGLAEGEFLPYSSSWPNLRDGYLSWLHSHEASGAQFDQAEVKAEKNLPLDQGSLLLVGQIDRIDSTSIGTGSNGTGTWVMDYKTESVQRTQARLKAGTEDTQLAFYAALMPDTRQHSLRAAYVNVGEKGSTQLYEATDIASLHQALVQGIRHDFDRIAQGVPLRALGEASACDWCAVRGLCRKDFWDTLSDAVV